MTIVPLDLRSTREPFAPLQDVPRGLDRQHAVDHLAGKAEIVRRIAQLLELLATDVPGNLLVGGKEVDQRLAARRGLAADIVDEVVRALATEMWPEPHHHLFRNDRAAGQVEIRAHARSIDLQAFDDVAGLSQGAGAEQ